MFLINSIELLLVVCWNCFCVSVVILGFVFVFVSILFWCFDDQGLVYIILIVVRILVNNVSIMVVFISMVLFNLQVCMIVILFLVYSLFSVISSFRNRFKGRMSCVIFGMFSFRSESIRFVGILLLIVVLRIFINF